MKKTLLLLSFLVIFLNLTKAQSTHLWATTADSGANKWGTIVTCDSIGGTWHATFSFNYTDGWYAEGKLLLADGKLFGNTRRGGTGGSCVMFVIDTATGQSQAIYDYEDFPSNGTIPYSGMTLGKDGMIYGIASEGGANNEGAIFKLDPSTYQYTDIYDFVAATGGLASNEFMLGNDGKFYATCGEGGANGDGVIFSYDISTNTYTDLYDFVDSNGQYGSYGALIQGPDDKIYGVNTWGGANYYNTGVAWSFDPKTKTCENLHTFGIENYPDTILNALGGLMLAKNGLLYGMSGYNEGYSSSNRTQYGGIYTINPTTKEFKMVYKFDTLSGCDPLRSLVPLSNGQFSAACFHGGVHNCGTIIMYDTATNKITKLIDFEGATTGANPNCDVLEYGAKITTGIVKLMNDLNTLNVFPNPVISTLNVQYSGEQPLAVLDVLGRNIGEIETSGCGITTVDITSYPSVFFIKTANGIVREVVKE